MLKEIINYPFNFRIEKELKNASEVIMVIKRKNGTLFHNCSTGKRSDKAENVVTKKRHIFLSQKSNIISGFYPVYDAKQKAIYLYDCTFNTHAIKEGEIRKWTLRYLSPYSILYIFDKEYNVYTTGNVRYELERNLYDLLDITATCYTSKIHYNFNMSNTKLFHFYLEKIVKKLYQNGYTEQFSFNPLNNLYNFSHIMKYCPNGEINKKKQEVIDKFSSYKLNELNDKQKDKIMQVLIRKSYRKNIGSIQSFENDLWMIKSCSNDVFSIINTIDDIAVIRYFYSYVDVSLLNGNTDINEGNIINEEFGRVYVTKDEIYACQKINNKWVYYKKGSGLSHYSSIIVDYDCVENTKLKYFKSLLDESTILFKIAKNKDVPKKTDKTDYLYEYTLAFNECRKVVKTLYSMLYSDFIECIMKSNYDEIKNYIGKSFNNGTETPKTIMSRYFGEIEDKHEKNFIKSIGYPSYSFEIINNMLLKDEENYIPHRVFYNAKKLKDGFDSDKKYFINMNKSDYESLLESFMQFDKKYSYGLCQSIFKNLIKLNGPKNCLNYINSINKCIEWVLSNDNCFYNGYNKDYTRMYLDYLFMCNKLEGFNELPWKFNSKESLEKAHDNIVKIYNNFKDKAKFDALMEKWNKVNSKWDKYEYYENEFSVIIPKLPLDIANEGISLAHCVKTYIDAVCDGVTNIFFVRKTNDLDTPFYTLEVRNNKIRQCHGYSNCYISEVDGLEEFLKRYCESKKIAFNIGEKALCVNI